MIVKKIQYRTYKCCAFVRLSNPLPMPLVDDTGSGPLRLLLDTSSHFMFFKRPTVAGNAPVNAFCDNPLKAWQE